MFVIFVAPFFSPAASQMIEAILGLPDVRLGVVAQQPREQLAPSLAARLAAHWRVDDVTNSEQLEWAVRSLQFANGPVARCFGGSWSPT